MTPQVWGSILGLIPGSPGPELCPSLTVAKHPLAGPALGTELSGDPMWEGEGASCSCPQVDPGREGALHGSGVMGGLGRVEAASQALQLLREGFQAGE